MRRILLICSIFVTVLMIMQGARSDPQAEELLRQCSNSNTTNDLSIFLSNFNKTFSDMRKQLSNGHFATAYYTDVFGLVQCRNYLSIADCVACFDAGLAQIRRDCPQADGAHLIYQGCFLRYEARNFYKQISFEDSSGVCINNRTASEPAAFKPAVEELLTDLIAATPKIKSFYAASKRQVFDGGPTAIATVYVVAQCVQNISQSDCDTCLSRAYINVQTCPPQAGGSSVDAGCFLRYSDTAFFTDNDVTDITQYVEGGSSTKKTPLIAGLIGGLCLVLLMSVLLLWYRLLRKSKKAERGDISGVTKLQGAVMYNYKDLKSATNNFSLEYKVGEGGFGDVYKGIIANGNIVAVKKLAVVTSKEKTDFESEVRLISNVHHRNILRLLGCSGKGPVQLLVYEFMENGSLDTFLYGDKRGTLSWKQRMDIILGIARGLAYLHEQFHVCIIHRDMKSSNILLDDDLQPKIADFGLARLLPKDQSHLTTRFAGTLGYTAPEYAIHGHLSEKVDTYGFGIVVLEIISGRRCSDMINEHLTESLLQYTWKLYDNGKHFELMDETLDPTEYNVDNAKKIIEIALKCTQSPVSSRPAMSEVVVQLVNDGSVEQRPPNKPKFVQMTKNIDDDSSTSTAPSISNATATLTKFTGR
ncbi:cysteine-rich receptor-like protein kinase 2 [Apium graveolens]|uniref:cysteine-rich receptor-like protein kinase 2 n=1 Tax=Apium graveolens TaxID=4045 RepID=UPI003D79F804